ncbi:LysR family transcriptional regulator [Sulfuriferula sp. AH1]|uniref:LysR family transcriptional regulator n=1 Tax=Sulfuriferula sp. AH1 TaxID=1985873 RepID=UPI000B3B5915|nr:LysR family transcriptional regulator [Sulfuriferula sp. AH1]ARU31054.1 LysR family transcriptional regulator [Sulfuriferula sp. AH1]
MKHATLHQLKIFEVVARNLSFTRAAEELHLTQPTVSIQIKQLTDIVGMSLLEQVGKRIFLTEAGRELLTVCHSLFDGLSRFEMIISDMKGVKTGKLRLGVITTAKYFVPRLLGPFCDRYPGIEVSLKVTNRERLLQRLIDNEDDLYILGQPPEHMDIWVEPFLDNPLVVLAPYNHPLAGEKNISAERIAQEPFLMRESGSGTRLATEKFFNERGLSLNVRMELGSNEAIKQAVAGGLGVAVLSAHTLALEKSGDELAVLDVAGFPIMRQWHVAYSTGKQLSVVARTFLEFLQQESGPMAERYMKGLSGFPSQAARKSVAKSMAKTND